MSEEIQCNQCGAVLAADAPQGLCPACLLKRGFATSTGGGESNNQGARTEYVPPPPAELARHFPELEIMGLVGRGGMGVVYKARQKRLDRLVALKILPPNVSRDAAFSERFTREAKALARLTHPNIVTVHDFGQADGLFYFVMEYVDGMNLRQLLDTGRMAPKEALAIVPQICDALQFAHDKGVVHRDIKPENILIDKTGVVKIADFGLAKIVGPEAKDLTITSARDVIGTPHYMAPEQVEHPQDVDHRADIYSLGVVFYQMLTGELPIGRFAPPSRKVQIDVRLDEVVLRALEKEPEQRYQHASDVKTQVETILTTPPTARQPQQSFSPGPWRTGVDYKSKTTIWGFPLVHVATGFDPATGRQRIATGIIAIGGLARGVIAFGGIACGVLSFGGLSVGGIAYGGLAIGLTCFGGLAAALLVALGGLAIAPIALGGCAVGYMAYGGAAVGAHVVAAYGADPVAKAFFEPWAWPLLNRVLWGNLILMGITIPLVSVLPLWLQWRAGASSGATGRDPAPTRSLISIIGQVVAAGVALLFACLVVLLAMGSNSISAETWSWFRLSLEILAAAFGLTFLFVVYRAITTRTPEAWQAVKSAAPWTIVTVLGIVFGFWSQHLLTIRSDYIGQTWFPGGDSIEITSVVRTKDRLMAKGHYNLVSHDSASLALFITTTNRQTASVETRRTLNISKGAGDFELVHAHPVPGLAHVSMYADGHPFASVYFGTKTEALEESQANWITNAPASADAGQPVAIGSRDNIDLPFVNDPQVIGEWESVDFVTNVSDFNPEQRNWSGDLYLKRLTFLDGGRTPQPWWTWTKGILIHHGDQTASRYEIREIKGENYLFLEWKSGDVTIRGMKPDYYVLRKKNL